MKADIELSLIHDGKLWVGRNDKLEAKGESLNDLDEDIKHTLRKNGEYHKGAQVTVFMGFDFDTIPTWLRQYHSHYFNRSIVLEI